MPVEGIIFDDIGSYPLPKGVRLQQLSQDKYLSLVKDALAQKISAGVEAPTYPQFRDMIRMFMEVVEDPDRSESPFLVKKEYAEIAELGALERGEKVRVCVTGPIELYLSVFGATAYEDILGNLAESVARFLERAVSSGRVCMTSLDEPSLGISSSLVFSDEAIIKALETASRPCRGLDCEVHLHSPLYAPLCCQVRGISIVGMESAANPDYLRLIDRSLLEQTDKFLRAGIARTDILSMAARRSEQLGENLWEDPARLEGEIMRLESPRVMEKRLKDAYAIFGDHLRAVGPDCGLGSWPSQEMAWRLLNSCSMALRAFRAEHSQKRN
jgi:5-methyltetrahydropteroyltriglutamate--homocysteine methyltransferase